MENPLNNILNSDPVSLWHAAWCIEYPLYEERPVDIITFINSPEYMNAKDECWEPIKEDLKELFEGYDDPLMEWKYNEAVFDEGIGAGKSYKSSVIITYLLYRILILKNPHKFLHLASGSGIYIMNMSVRAQQASKVVFGEIAQRVRNSPWFTKRGYLPRPDIKSELQFPKNIYVIPGNSKETFPLGFNLLAAVMDEAAWYTETDDHDVAEEIFNALHNRIKNRFGHRGMLMMISSPRYIDDFIEKKMREAETNTRIYAKRRTSWESKPANRFSGEKVIIEGHSIPIEYKIEAERNWDRFKRDIMAIPSLALEPYFKQWNLVEQMFTDSIKNPVLIGTKLQDWFYGNPSFQYYLHIDLSLVSDCTGIGMAHNEGENIVIDLAMKIKPPPNGEIDLSEIRALVLELKARGFGIQKCTYDQYQSASSIQELNKMGITSEQLSVDKTLAPYETLKEMIYAGKVKTYINGDLRSELQRLELIEGKKVDHPSNGSKDCADGVAGAVFNCMANRNMFSYGFSGGINKQKDKRQILEEEAVKPAEHENLVPYGYYQRMNLR